MKLESGVIIQRIKGIGDRLTKDQRANWNSWIEALRSGKYKQGFYSLKGNNCFCALGVLCDIYVQKDPSTYQWSHHPDAIYIDRGIATIQSTNEDCSISDALPSIKSTLFNPAISEGYFPKVVCEGGKEVTLIGLNDTLKATFEEIATVLTHYIGKGYEAPK